jgi:formate dehydrogenase subunit gamma
MTAVRASAAAAALVLAALFIWVAIISLGREAMVVPEVAVRAAPGTGGSPSDLLIARTHLQAEESVASGDRVVRLHQSEGRLEMSPGVPVGRTLAETWIGDTASKAGRLLQAPEYREGRSTYPYAEAGVLVQPDGRDFRRSHNDQIRYGGGWVIFGVALALALFLFARGRIPLAEGESGIGILRFTAVERANHWMTASAFIIMALTGLVILYGKPLLLPWMGYDVFSTLAGWSAWVHMSAAVPFAIGVVLMVLLWIRDNLPSWLDWEWLKRGGGFLRDDGNNPPAERFNAGQKIVFWGVVLGGFGLLATGVTLMFPFYWFGYAGMQWAQLLHAAIALGMVALIVGHIYIGTVGMVGAFDAMWSGFVDRNWAHEHHSLWLERLRRRQEPAE